MKGVIELGDLARDTVTGFTGVVTAKTKWLNGCERLMLQSQKLKDGKPIEGETFDILQLELVKKAVVASAPQAPVLKLAETGGPRPNAKGMPSVRGMR